MRRLRLTISGPVPGARVLGLAAALAGGREAPGGAAATSFARWPAIAAGRLWRGVSRAGDPLREPLPIFLPTDGLPVLAARPTRRRRA